MFILGKVIFEICVSDSPNLNFNYAIHYNMCRGRSILFASLQYSLIKLVEPSAGDRQKSSVAETLAGLGYSIIGILAGKYGVIGVLARTL